MQVQTCCLRLAAVAEPCFGHRKGCYCSSAAIEEVESGAGGPWRHAGGRGDGEVVSVLVEGRSRVAWQGLSSRLLKQEDTGPSRT